MLVATHQPVYDAKTMDERWDEMFVRFRTDHLRHAPLVWPSSSSMSLAAIGVYGVVAFSVCQRTREIGIRAALGADRRSLLILVLRQRGWILTAGLVPGRVAALAAATGLRSLVQDVSAQQIAAGLAGTALVLGWCASSRR